MASSFQLSPDLLPPNGHVPAFATVGVGGMLAASLSTSLLSDRSGFPFLARGRALLLVADFGGHHQKQYFDTYTFLILDLTKNQEWLAWQHHFRHAILRNRRPMSFKALNDGMRRRLVDGSAWVSYSASYDDSGIVSRLNENSDYHFGMENVRGQPHHAPLTADRTRHRKVTGAKTLADTIALRTTKGPLRISSCGAPARLGGRFEPLRPRKLTPSLG